MNEYAQDCRFNPGYWMDYPRSQRQSHSTVNANVVGPAIGIGLHLNGPQGFGIDLDGDGQYQKGKDAVLAFDLNKDGAIDNNEISASKAILNSVNTPKIKAGPCGQEIDNPLYKQAQALGLTNGPINGDTLARAGGRVLRDKGDNPFAPNWETHSVYDVPMPNGRKGALASVDPIAGHAVTDTRWGWSRPRLPNFPC
ncbi:hypothetical protein IV102_37070 [bacterium]|nr:hypothetical protein [bacterium]